MRKLGLKAVIYEAGTGLGGTWRWNCYPGARVDSEVPDYEFSIPEVWKDWSWSTNYPDYEEIRAYFDHVDKVLNISKDTAFETVVVDAQFHTDNGKWHVKTEDGRLAKAKYFIAAVGPTSKRHIPDFPGLEKFQGILHHSSFWPDEGVDVKGKRVAVIGTGASGVQLVQAIGPEAASLTVIQRTPNLCLPMTRKLLTVEELNTRKMFYPHLFRLREKDTGGYHYGRSERYTFDDSPEEREEYFQTLWDQGGFHFWVSGYKDLLTDMKANQEAYNFWAKTVRKEIIDPVKRDVLA